jgi:hypothetical protein
MVLFVHAGQHEQHGCTVCERGLAMVLTLDSTEAKQRFGAIHDEVRRQHIVAVQHYKKTWGMMIAPSLVARAFREALPPDPLHVHYQPLGAEDGGGMSMWQPTLMLHAQGETVEGARQAMVSAALDYADHYLERLDYYLHTDRATHLPYILMIVTAAQTGDNGVFRLLFPAIVVAD